MKKYRKLFSLLVLAVAFMGSVCIFTGCSLEDKNQIIDEINTTTNAIATEYSADLAKIMLADAVNKSINTKHITMEGCREGFDYDGVYSGRNELITYEKIEDNKSTIYMEITNYTTGSTIGEAQNSWIIFTNDKYYIYDMSAMVIEQLTSDGFMGCSRMLNSMLKSLSKVCGAKYYNGVTQIMVESFDQLTMITLDKEERINSISITDISSESTVITQLNFSYKDFTFPEELPTI